ncbi:MAG: ATP-binding protein [Burkholderiales bacterium]|nr:MAG: ATP-binding protein [Burkholderiales bacterium]
MESTTLPAPTPVVSQPTAELPSADLLPEGFVWTPEIERMANAIGEQIRLDSPGMMVSGAQRNGKSSACAYLAAVLPSVIGYPLHVVIWNIPGDEKYTVRAFLQERLAQCNYDAISHRDVAVLRKRLIDVLVERTAQRAARRIVMIVDEAQNLSHEDFKRLVHIFNELNSRSIRPFIVLVGQPELKNLTDQWTAMNSMQFVGRFCSRKHDFLGIELADLEAVLAGFDDEEDPEVSAAFRVAPRAYAEGWRIAHLAPLIADAVRAVASAQNVQEAVRLPMQYLRGCLLSMLYRIVQDGMRPQLFQPALAMQCLIDSGFADVLQYYIRKENKGSAGTGGRRRAAKEGGQ